MTKRKPIKQGMAIAALLALISLEIFFVRFLCTYDGFMTPRQFGTGAVIAVSFNLLIVFFMRSVLPFRLWQVPLLTVCGMWMAWYNPAPERLHYWLTMERLHVGMTIREVQNTVKPYVIQEEKSYWYVSGHTQYSPYYDATYVTTQNGVVTEIRSCSDD